MKQRGRMYAAIAGVLLSLPDGTLQAGPWVPGSGSYYAQLGFTHQSAGRAYDAAGIRRPLAGRAEFVEQRLDLYGECGLGSGLAVVAAGPLQWARLDGNPKRINSGFGDGYLGLRGRLSGGTVVMALEAGARWPLGYEPDGSPALGDGVFDYQLVWAGGRGWSSGHGGYAQVEFGYRSRTAEPADEWLYALAFGLGATPSLRLWAELRGVKSRGSVGFAGSIIPDAAAVSESYDGLSLAAGYRAGERLELHVAYSTVVAGMNTLSLTGWRFAAALKR